MKILLSLLCISVLTPALHGRTLFLARHQAGEDPATRAEIEKKWDKMDDVLEALFSIACNWKHGKDLDGVVADMVKEGKIEHGDAMTKKRSLQAENVQRLKEACGFIVASGKSECRQSCANRWGNASESRNQCDAKCVDRFTTLEARCRSKADDLKTVYEMKANLEASRERCYDDHCKEFPTVWTKVSVDSMNEEVKSQCEGRCTPEQIASRCETKWVLQVDFIRDGVRSECAAQQTISSCFEKRKAAVSGAHETCRTEGKGVCEAQYNDCNTKGSVDSSRAEAAGFCDERNRLCLEQVDANCLGDQKVALEKAHVACDKETLADAKTCEEEAISSKRDVFVSKCKTDAAPGCVEDCAKTCDVGGLNSCVSNLGTRTDPLKEFCKDFWSMLHSSSTIDAVSGDPIAAAAA